MDVVGWQSRARCNCPSVLGSTGQGVAVFCGTVRGERLVAEVIRLRTLCA